LNRVPVRPSERPPKAVEERASEGDDRLSALEKLAQFSGPGIEYRLHESLAHYWRRRVKQHFNESYAGVPMTKFPEDLAVYAHLLWATRPNVVIEIGTYHGGSALWFRDQLRTLAAYGHVTHPRVISIDLDTERARESMASADPGFERDITLISSDVSDPELPDRVAELAPVGANCLVVEDAAHTRATTSAALAAFHRFVSPGGFFVVEDGCVDIDSMRLRRGLIRRRAAWPRGVLPAIDDWLRTPAGSGFVRRRDLELYGMTCHPGGFLQRRTGAA